MRIESDEQRTELLARLIYGLSQMRYWQKINPNDYETDLLAAKNKWEGRMDELLENLGAAEYQSLKEIIAQLKTQNQTTQ